MGKYDHDKTMISVNVFWALVSGLLLFCSFPKFGTGLIAWVALVPLFFSLEKVKPAEGFRIGFLAGLVAHTGIFYWIVAVIVQYSYLPPYFGVTAMLFLASYLSLYTACFAALVVYFQKRGLPLIFSAPILWTLLEYAKSHLFTGFPWENLAYSQYLQHRLIQVADVTGMYGITFLIVMVNVFFYRWLSSGSLYQFPWKQAGGVSLLFLLILGYGQYRIGHIDESIKKAESIEIAIIQGNIDQNIKWDSAYQTKTLEIYSSLSREAGLSSGGLIVWPETAVPFYFNSNEPLRTEVLKTAQSTGSYLLFGSPSYEEKNGNFYYRNSAYLLQPDGGVNGRYDKVHLVPYGEYVPLRQFFPFIGKLVEGVGDFAGGSGYSPISMDGRSLGVLICYEGIFPKGARSYKQSGTDLLINITNDAWFGRTSAPHQHLSMTVFRAVENRLYLVRAANTGISAIVDPRGMILSKTGLFERTILKGEVKLIDESSIYAAYSDIFVFVCGITLLMMLYLSKRKRRTDHAGRNQ
jgi:apolipoprotein N-acyltransferase